MLSAASTADSCVYHNTVVAICILINGIKADVIDSLIGFLIVDTISRDTCNIINDNLSELL